MKKAKPKLLIDWASHEAAKYACENWHYSKCLSAGKSVKVGVWENDKFIGVVVFGLGATPNLSKSYNLSMTECCELTRVALSKHMTPVSKIVSIAIRFLKKTNPGLRLIVSFADYSGQNHVGTIYQAGNWIYSGSAKLDQWMINNKMIHPRSVVAKYGTQAEKFIKEKVDKNAKKIWGIKHRYLMPLDVETSKKIESLRKPYPKRASSVESGTSEFHSERGGESPTDALQLESDNG